MSPVDTPIWDNAEVITNAELPWGNVDGCEVSAALSRLPGSALCCVMSDGGETGSLLRPRTILTAVSPFDRRWHDVPG